MCFIIRADLVKSKLSLPRNLVCFGAVPVIWYIKKAVPEHRIQEQLKNWTCLATRLLIGQPRERRVFVRFFSLNPKKYLIIEAVPKLQFV